MKGSCISTFQVDSKKFVRGRTKRWYRTIWSLKILHCVQRWAVLKQERNLVLSNLFACHRQHRSFKNIHQFPSRSCGWLLHGYPILPSDADGAVAQGLGDVMVNGVRNVDEDRSVLQRGPEEHVLADCLKPSHKISMTDPTLASVI